MKNYLIVKTIYYLSILKGIVLKNFGDLFMEILTPDDLKTKFKDPWVAPYKKVITMVDNDQSRISRISPLCSRF